MRQVGDELHMDDDEQISGRQVHPKKQIRRHSLRAASRKRVDGIAARKRDRARPGDRGARVVVSDTQACPRLALVPETIPGNRGVQQRGRLHLFSL
jgi:hypothetical protein